MEVSPTSHLIFWNNALSIFFKTSNGRLSCPNIFFQRKIGFESYVAAYVRYLCEWIIAFCWKLYHACHNTVGNFLNILIKSKWIKTNIPYHTTQTVRNNWEKLEHIGEAIFDIPFMIQSHTESVRKILGAH